MAEISRYRSFIQKGGVTLSGGEPLAQPEFCAELLRLCRAEGLHTAVDTSGAVPLEHCRGAVDEADLLLLDIKALDPTLCREITGQDNAGALRTLALREELHKPVWIRHVLLPGYTLQRERLEQLAAFLAPYTCIEQVELLPFHKMGEFKWEQLQLPYRLSDVQPPTFDQVDMAREIFARAGLPVHG